MSHRPISPPRASPTPGIERIRLGTELALHNRRFRVALIALGAMTIVFGRTVPACAWPSQRIIALAPSVTETLFAIGAGAELVGVSQYCDFPPAVLKLPKVGSFLTPNVEEIVGLRPGLIVGLQTSANEREIRALESMGYPVLLISDDSLQGIEHGIESIGERTGHVRQARDVLNSLHARMNEVTKRLRGSPARRVLMVVGHDPLVAVGGGYLNQLLGMANCVNIAGGLGAEWPRISLEYIIAAAPDVILDGQMGSDPETPSGFWSRYPNIPAVRNHRICGYDQNAVLRPGPQIGETLQILASLTHPEAFAAKPAARSDAAMAGTESAHPR
jgi:iron complex transport system substrate-binding protein